MRRISLLAILLISTTVFAADPIERERGGFGRGRHFVLETNGPLTDAQRADLAARGVDIQHALTNGRLLARVADSASLPAGMRIAPLSVDEKLHRGARKEISRAREHAHLNVIFHKDVTFDEARTAIAAAGGSLFDPLATQFAPMQRVQAFIPAVTVRALAEDDRVMAIAGPVRFRMQSDNAKSAELAHVTELYSAPYNLTGEGVVVSLYELAAAQVHNEFQGRMTVHATGGGGGDATHATHVAGTIGAGGINAEAKGMAPKVTIHQYRASGNADVWLGSKRDNLAPLGVVADNNSWGYVLGWQDEGGQGLPVWNDFEEYYGGYDLILAAPLDQITREKGVLFVHSAGNDGDLPSLTPWKEHRHINDDLDPIIDKVYCVSQNGSGSDCPVPLCSTGAEFCERTVHLDTAPFDTIGVTAAAKNILTVGATDGTEAIIPFSSRGPAKDGRIKPEVVARGFNVLSTVPVNQYGRLSGTSMSSPAVTGVVALVTEQWHKLHSNATPGPAVLKALIIAGARDQGNPGPDYSYGFGHVNAKASVDLIIADGGKGTRIKTGTLAQGATFEMPVAVRTAQDLRVVLHWSDPEIAFLGGDDLAAVALVNDLDVKVIAPNGSTVLPYVLDKVNYTANATRGVNNVDNTELLEIAGAQPGVYRIIVTGTKITEQSPQAFVVVANADLVPACRDLTEQNDPYGDLVSGQAVNAALCSATDNDFFRFTATKNGPVSVTVRSNGDTALRVTLSRNGGTSTTLDVPAGESRTLTLGNQNATPSSPAGFTVKVEPSGAAGIDTSYTLTPTFGTTVPPRRRSVRP